MSIQLKFENFKKDIDELKMNNDQLQRHVNELTNKTIEFNNRNNDLQETIRELKSKLLKFEIEVCTTKFILFWIPVMANA